MPASTKIGGSFVAEGIRSITAELRGPGGDREGNTGTSSAAIAIARLMHKMISGGSFTQRRRRRQKDAQKRGRRAP